MADFKFSKMKETWNVRTMLASLKVALKDINDVRKTAIINDELLKLNVDIATYKKLD